MPVNVATSVPLLQQARRWIAAAVLCVGVFAAELALAEADQVQTTYGAVAGTGVQPSGVRIFRGIPFAAPPVKDLRWRPPQPPKQWTGILQATEFGPNCVQPPVFADIRFRSRGMSEDCLYLNVWTPAKSADERRPVLVYFYGGGFVAGDGSEPRYDGESTACRGIVMVTLNYRLGVLGFLAHPQLSREAAYKGSGNYGLLDQAAALRWVHDNIAAFGGDPRRVTIAGESAGSISVSAQMASPLSRDLIAGAIGESGSILGALPAVELAEAESVGVQFANQAGANSLDALRALPAERVLELAVKFGVFRFPRTIDSHFFPKSPEQIFRAGEQAHVPLLAGSNSEEMSAAVVLGRDPPTLQAYRKAVGRLYGEHADAVLKAYPAASDGEPVLDAAQALASDRFVAQSTWKWMDLATRTGGKPTFYYYFARQRPPLETGAEGAGGGSHPPARGALHAAEIEYALGNLNLSPMYDWAPEDHEISRIMQGYIVQFVASGNPNTAALPRWPEYASGRRMILDTAVRDEPDFAAARGRVLDALPPESKPGG
jgi:para-nitrobenzyl esterase